MARLTTKSLMHCASNAASNGSLTEEQRHDVMKLYRDELYKRDEPWYSASSWEDSRCAKGHMEYVRAHGLEYALTKLDKLTKGGLEYMLMVIKDPRHQDQIVTRLEKYNTALAATALESELAKRAEAKVQRVMTAAYVAEGKRAAAKERKAKKEERKARKKERQKAMRDARAARARRPAAANNATAVAIVRRSPHSAEKKQRQEMDAKKVNNKKRKRDAANRRVRAEERQAKKKAKWKPRGQRRTMQTAHNAIGGTPPSGPLNLVMRLRGGLAANMDPSSEEEDEPLAQVTRDLAAAVLDDDGITESEDDAGAAIEEATGASPPLEVHKKSRGFLFLYRRHQNLSPALFAVRGHSFIQPYASKKARVSFSL
jgi:hypothetical protein